VAPEVSTAGDTKSHARSRAELWRQSTFGPSSEQPYRRRTSDWLRLAIALAVVVGTCFHVNDLTEPERALFQTFNSLPNDLNAFFDALYQIGSLWAVGLVVGAALIGRRWRLARDLAIAGVGAWFIGHLLGSLIVDDKSLGNSLDVVVRLGASPWPRRT
jgi:undecaprenyl-diphosphatase